MILILVGLLLWTGFHVFKRLAPDARAGMGNAGKGLAAIGILAGLVLMVIGYRGSETVLIWSLPLWTVHVNNTLMLLAVWVYGSSHIKGGGKVWPATITRHPQLWSVVIWAVAHLLVNGDQASVLLFGGLLLWALLEMVLINRAEPGWTPPPPAPARKVVVLGVITLAVFAVIAAIHVWLGVWPFPG